MIRLFPAMPSPCIQVNANQGCMSPLQCSCGCIARSVLGATTSARDGMVVAGIRELVCGVQGAVSEARVSAQKMWFSWAGAHDQFVDGAVVILLAILDGWLPVGSDLLHRLAGAWTARKPCGSLKFPAEANPAGRYCQPASIVMWCPDMAVRRVYSDACLPLDGECAVFQTALALLIVKRSCPNTVAAAP